jgi:hypothetical protein
MILAATATIAATVAATTTIAESPERHLLPGMDSVGRVADDDDRPVDGRVTSARARRNAIRASR